MSKTNTSPVNDQIEAPITERIEDARSRLKAAYKRMFERQRHIAYSDGANAGTSC